VKNDGHDPTRSWGNSPMDPPACFVEGEGMETIQQPIPQGPPNLGGQHARPPQSATSQTPNTESETPGGGRPLLAIVAAFGLQVVAVITAYIAFGIALLAAFSSWATSEATPWWGALAVPVAVGALAIYGASGLVAVRIARTPRAWATLVLLPAAALTTTAAIAIV